ncbi:MAG TPA: ATP-binding protein [Verrucomicrobiae bacterium]
MNTNSALETVQAAPDGLGKFAGHVAHDFNNLLTVIRGYAQTLIDDGDLNESALEALEQIDHAAKRAADLISQMLTLSQTNAPQRKHLDLNELVAQYSKILRPPAGKEITMLFQHSGDTLGIHADRAMIEQVLMGLVNFSSNAARDGGTVWVRTEDVSIAQEMLRHFPKARAGRFACISIKDSGEGISAEALPHLFEPYSTATESSHGLMLAAANHAVKQHAGWIDVESEPGRGTTFRIFLPLVSETCFEVCGRWSNIIQARGHETILLVEDEDAVRSLTSKILHGHGYRVIEARSGAEAMTLLKKQNARVDLLLADWELADGGSGAILSAELQRLYPALRTIYTTNSTSCSSDAIEHVPRVESRISFLPKPYCPNDLALAIRRSLDAAISIREYPSALLAN